MVLLSKALRLTPKLVKKSSFEKISINTFYVKTIYRCLNAAFLNLPN